MKLNVLIACEESQAECIAFRNLGHYAFSCDIQKCRKNGHPEWHVLDDVTKYLDGCSQFKTMDGKSHHLHHWDLIVAHPPCTYLCKVGSVWLYQNVNGYVNVDGRDVQMNIDRYKKMIDARNFFYKCLEAKATYVAVENPLPMRLANLPKPTCFACPSWFGVKYTKKTLYWLRGLPPLMAENIHPNPLEYVRASCGKYRSRTFPAMAEALARQWSKFIEWDEKFKRQCNTNCQRRDTL